MITEIDYPSCKINITKPNYSLELASDNIKLTQSAIGNSDIIVSAGQVCLTNVSQTNTMLCNGNTLVDGNDTNQSVASFILLKDNLNNYENNIRSNYTILSNASTTYQNYNDYTQTQITNFNSSSQVISRMNINSGNMTIVNNTSNSVNINTDRFELINSTTTTQITPNQITINGSSGSVSQVLTKDASNNMVWANGTAGWVGTATSNLNMSSYAINNIASLNAISATDMNINGQAVFDTPPHIPDPILGNDAASKGYVDTLIGNYSGNGLTLYFNYTTTQTDPIIAPSTGALQQTLLPVDSPTTDNYYTMRSVALGTDTLISTFTTDVGYPNTLTIPTGLWSMLIWGYSTGTGGNLYYHFHLNEVNSAGAFVAQIGTSGFSSDVNAISSADPDAYHCSLALIAPYTMASVSNRLQIKIYTTGTGAVPTYLYTLFGGDYYSNVITTLSGATGLLTQNNTWTGTNNFEAVGITSLTPATNTNTTAVATTAWTNTYFALASSLASYGLIAGSNTWSGIQNFQSATLSALTQLTNTNSTLVATTQWVNNWFGKIAGQVWTGTQDFTSATTTASTQGTNTNNTLVATTAWVNSYFALASSLASYGLIAGGSAWSGIQNFQSSTLSALTQLTNTNSTLVATTAWVNNWFGKIAGQVWTGTQDFTSATTTASTQGTNTNNTLVATTAWVNTWFALTSSLSSYGLIAGGSAWSGTQNFQSATLSALTQVTNTNSTAVATTQWVNSWFGLKAGPNTWTGSQNFTGASSLSAPTQASNTNTTAVATTEWVNTYFGAKAGAIWTGSQDFTGAGLTATSQATNTNTTDVATTAWTNTFFTSKTSLTSQLASYALKASANTWSGVQDFTGATLNALTQATNIQTNAVATTSWVNTFFGAKAGATWTGNQNFTGATTTALTQLSNTNTDVVATTAWTNTYYAPKASATFTGTTTFATISGSGNTGTTLGLTTPIIPSSITYTAGTGTTIAGTIGLVSIGTGNNNVTINTTQTNVTSVAINSVGVYMISGVFCIRNAGSAGTNDRIVCNVGYGASTGTNSDVVSYNFSKITLGTTNVTGIQMEFPFTTIFTIGTLLSPSFFTLSVANSGTTTLSLVSQASEIRAIRIA